MASMDQNEAKAQAPDEISCQDYISNEWFPVALVI